MASASAIEDVGSLPGEILHDQDGQKIGKILQLYAVGEDKAVMWVTVEATLGIANKRELFVPLARIKEEHDQLRVPYSTPHIQSAPQIDAAGDLSEREDRALRNYYAIDLADQELRTDNDSYAGQVPNESGAARPIDADQAREPDRDTGEAAERMREDGSADEGLDDEPRKATADDVFESR
jgi:hypothetical protein